MATNANQEKGFMGLQEASHYSGLSLSTLRRLTQTGKLRAFRPTEGRIMVAKRDLDVLFENNAVPPNAAE
jgi:excisionase family DNA binding protein